MKSVLITGGTKGMGRAISTAFAQNGFNLAICSRNQAELASTKAELQSINPDIKIVAMQADCSIRAQVQAFAAYAAQQLGFINVIVNNVGMYQPTSILDDDDDAFAKLLNTNLLPAYELYRYFGKTMMAARAGHVFNICSVAAINPVKEAGMYTVTKYALLGLSNIMRLEMQDHGVKVTTILPGSTFTDSWKDSGLPPEKFVSPQDIASAIINAYKMSAGANVDEIVIKPVLGQM